MGAGRLLLLGVLYAGPQHRIDGTIRVVTIPDSQSLGVQSCIPNNLGYIIKSKTILDFVPILKERIKA